MKKNLRWIRKGVGIAAFITMTGLGVHAAWAYTVPYSTPPGITLVDVSKVVFSAIPDFLWRRLGDAEGNPLYTYDADQPGRSGCYAECAKEFPPFVTDAHARASGDWSIILRDDHVRQWAYQGKPLYRYSGKNPGGEPTVGVDHQDDPAWFDPASKKYYSPKAGWRRAAYMPEKSAVMPADFALEGLAIANGFGLIDTATGMTVYAAPSSHRLSSDWRPMRAAALAKPLGDFSIIERRDDGTRQWTYKGDALYTFAHDYASGAVNGIFTGDNSIQAALVYRNFIPPGLEIGQYPGRGPLMTTRSGMTLYTVARYQVLYGGRETRTGYAVSYNDVKSQGTQGCQGDCTTTWKPVLAPAHAQARGLWEVAARPDGSKQWVFKGSPLYTYVGDRKPGDVRGNNRHVIVYGGSHGQIVYADAGGDPKDLSRLGNLDMPFAAGPRGRGEDAVAVNDVPQGAADKAAGAKLAAAKAAGAKAVDPHPDRSRGDRRDGAGFYWHTVGLSF